MITGQGRPGERSSGDSQSSIKNHKNKRSLASYFQAVINATYLKPTFAGAAIGGAAALSALGTAYGAIEMLDLLDTAHNPTDGTVKIVLGAMGVSAMTALGAMVGYNAIKELAPSTLSGFKVKTKLTQNTIAASFGVLAGFSLVLGGASYHKVGPFDKFSMSSQNSFQIAVLVEKLADKTSENISVPAPDLLERNIG